MKKIIFLLPLALLFLFSCRPNSYNTTTIVNYHSNVANFYIINLSSGDTVHNQGMVTNIGLDSVWSAPNNINAHHNDVLKLLYQPPHLYEQDEFQVTITAFDKVINLTAKPYEREITVTQEVDFGKYMIECDAISDSWTNGSSDNGIIQVTVIDSK